MLPSSLESGVSEMCRCGTTFPRVQIIRFSVVVRAHSKEELGNLGVTLERNYQEATVFVFSSLSSIRLIFSLSAELTSV